MRKRLLTTLLLVSLVLLLLPAAAQAMTFDQAMDKLVSSGWTKKMENKCVSFKGNALGYRSGGTASDDACARWIAAEMRKMGLDDVALEGVPGRRVGLQERQRHAHRARLLQPGHLQGHRASAAA